MKTFTCESCETQPATVANVELADHNDQSLLMTLCLECEATLHLPPSDGRRIALINRSIDFKQAWPVKAEMNFIGYIVALFKTDSARANHLLAMWSKAKRATA